MFCYLVVKFLLLVQLGHMLGVASQQHPLYRTKRQAGLQCPNRPASLSSRSSPDTSIIFHSQSNANDVSISHDSGGNWAGHGIGKTLSKYGFDPELPTLIYLHAYTQSSNSPWLKNVRKQHAKLAKGGANLFFYDWSSYSQRPYGTAASWVPQLGKDLAGFLEALVQQYQYNASSLHLVSYSLSTHIAGQAGREMKAKSKPIGQITALDPTGICFHTVSNGFSRDYALKKTDAELVLARHYDMGGLGARRLIGGVDILVNGGKNQPAANGRATRMRRSLDETSDDMDSKVVGASSHARAASHELTTDGKLESDCQEVAYACRSYAAYLNGECASCGIKGDRCYYVDTLGRLSLPNEDRVAHYKKNTKMYLKSGAGEKSCLYLYQVSLSLKPDLKQVHINLVTSGAVQLELKSGESSTKVVPKSLVDANGSGLKFTALVTRSSQFRKAKLDLNVTFNSNLSTKDRSALLESIRYVRVNYMSHAQSRRRAEASMKFCPSGENDKHKLVRC